MADIRESLAHAARDANIPADQFRPVGHTQWQPLLEDILDRFTNQGRKEQRRLWLWDDFKGEATTLVLEDAMESLGVLRSVLPPNESVWFVAEDYVLTIV